MTPTPATIARYRRLYPDAMLVFRTGEASNVVYLPDNAQPFTATVDETDEAILVAAQGGLRVLVIQGEMEKVKR